MNWYDRPDIYDVLFGWDPSTERDFVLGAGAKWGVRGPRRTLEPFCGSGRMLRALPGTVIGLDSNPHALRYAAERGGCVFRADAGDFGVRPGSFDLALNLIDSFRHLRTEEAAVGHLRSVARALRPGAVFVLGFDVAGPADVSVEEWEMERDGVTVHGRVTSLGDADPVTRIETMHSRMETGGEVIESFQPMRTYTARQAEDLIDDEGSFEITAVFDRRYDLDQPVELAEAEGSVILVLSRRRT